MSEREPSGPGSRASVLRRLEVADLDEIVELQRQGSVEGLGHVFPQDRFPFPVPAVRERWEKEIADPGIDCFAVLGPSGSLAGFAATKGDEFLHFGTAVATWGTGLAGLAHDAVVSHLAGRGFGSAWLLVFEANVRARRFYERRGWLATGERSASPFEPHPVLLHYRRELAPASAI